jgi:hypothetical protein
MSPIGFASTFQPGFSNNIQVSGKPTGVQTAYTLACILIWVTTPAVSAFFVATSNSAAGATLSTAGANVLTVAISGGSGFTTSIAPVANVPYLWAGSLLPGTSPNAIGNCVLVNLQTGAVQSQSTTATISTPTTDTGTCTIGNRGSPTVGCPASIVAAMYTTNFTPMSELLQWAADPWAFWYPK